MGRWHTPLTPDGSSSKAKRFRRICDTSSFRAESLISKRKRLDLHTCWLALQRHSRARSLCFAELRLPLTLSGPVSPIPSSQLPFVWSRHASVSRYFFLRGVFLRLGSYRMMPPDNTFESGRAGKRRVLFL